MKNKADTNNTEILYSLENAVAELKKVTSEKKRKFVETVDIVINLGIDAKQSDQGVRGSVALPAGSGKETKVIVFAKEESLQNDALKAGAIKAGLDELMAEIDKGFMDFDYCIATPEAMKSLSKIAKKLGPKGLMPNPKNGNITTDIKTAVEVARKGKVNFKNDKAGIVHAGVGKINFDDSALIGNIKVLLAKVKGLKPESAKGKYFKSVYLTSTMGPSIRLDVDNLSL